MAWKKEVAEATKNTRWVGFKLVFLAFLFVFVIGALSYVLGVFNEAGTVAQEEFGPRALLDKYEWFKDTLASLDAKNANIELARQRVDSLYIAYGDTPFAQWDRFDRQTHSQNLAELQGLVNSYNNLAGQYNAQMAKFNYRFTNVGTLPAGATEPLPREVAPYQYNLR